MRTGDKYLHEVDGKKLLRIVLSVRCDKYVWENVAQWTTVIEEYLEDEYTLCALSVGGSDVPVFVAHGLIGVLTSNKDKIRGELIIPSRIGKTTVKGVSRYGFYDCANLTKVIFSPMVVIAYEYAFAKSVIKDMTFNEEVSVMVHFTAVDSCENLPKFDRICDRPFSGLYLIHGGEIFQKWEEDLRKLHFLD